VAITSLIVPKETDPLVWCDPPADAPFPHPEHLIHPVFGAAVDVWTRTNKTGDIIGGQIRWVYNGEKQDRQFRWAKLNGFEGWTVRAGPKPWTLFGLFDLFSKPDAPVLIVEGPKTREAAAKLFPGWAVVAACGALTAKHFDWRDLQNRKAVIWPDADVPGLRFASSVCEILGLLMDTNVVCVPLEAERGWDLADPVPEGWSIEDMLCTATPAVAAINVLAIDADDLVTDEDRRDLHLPPEFWDSREVLSRCRDWCRTRRFPLDSTFVAGMTRIAAMLSPMNKLVTGLGEPVPPILFAMIVADSGGGKTIATAGAKVMIPRVEGLMVIDGASPGSGEGIEGAFCRKKADGSEWEQIRHNAWFCVDEGEVIQQIKRRNGATLGGKLRQLWTGGDLITQLAGTVRAVSNYTCGMTIAMQFSVLVEILSDSESSLGTPGRFLWIHAGDPELGKQAPSCFCPRMFWTPPGDITMHQDVMKEIDDDYCMRMRGEKIVETIDAHRNYLKARVSAILAIMDARDFVTPEDWDLAEIIMRTSDKVRSRCMIETQLTVGSRLQEELDKTVIKARVAKAAMDSGHVPEWHFAAAVAKRCRKMWSEGITMPLRSARSTLKHNGAMVFTALAYAENMGWIEKVTSKTWRPGPNVVPSRPDEY
jgi:hypothetical protein